MRLKEIIEETSGSGIRLKPNNMISHFIDEFFGASEVVNVNSLVERYQN
jgi:hypothetical protein